MTILTLNSEPSKKENRKKKKEDNKQVLLSLFIIPES
jgi:hypothetical protein